MKLRILNIISCLLVAACMITSCLNEDDNLWEYVPSSNASITAFSINNIETSYKAVVNGKDTTLIATVNGADYPFTIDQQQNLIYNTDSLPVGTDVSKVIVNITADTKAIFLASKTDTLWVAEDSLDYTQPVMFKIQAESGLFRTYKTMINVHQQVADSMVWKKMATNFNTDIQKQKSVFANNQIYTFVDKDSQVAVTTMNTKSHEWTALQTIQIPAKADYASVMIWNGQFYILAANELYTSADGLEWTKVETNQAFKQLTAGISLQTEKKLVAINTENQYMESEDGQSWTVYETVPTDFPTENLSFAAYPLITNPKLGRINVMGNEQNDQNKNLMIWTQLASDHEWTALTMEDNSNACPNLENPSMIHYNDQLYIFGGPAKNNEKIKAFSKFYSSIDNGITWEEKTEHILFPAEFTTLYQQAGGDYSYAIDQDNFLWIMWSQTGEVWRGRINKLGFDKK